MDNNYVGGSISPYGSPDNEDSESYARQLDEHPGSNPRMWQGREIRNDMTITGRKKPDVGLDAFKLPSTEQMRREVETGEFSPESIAVANSILENASDIESAVDSYIDERPAPGHIPMSHYEEDYWFEQRLADAEFAEAQKRDRSRQWMEEATKSVTPATAHFKKLGTETKKTTKAFKKMSKALPQKPAPGANLTHRPFLILSLIRDEL